MPQANNEIATSPGLPAILTENEAAGFLRLSIKTIQCWRLRRVGPKYVKQGRSIRYRMADLVAYQEANTVDPEALRTSVRKRLAAGRK